MYHYMAVMAAGFILCVQEINRHQGTTVYKNARMKNLRATLHVDRLIIQGSVHRDEEAKKFPQYAEILHPTE